MSSKKFLFLLALAIILLCFSIFGSNKQSRLSKNQVSPITGIDGTLVNKIVIESSGSSVELANVSDKWVVANRDNYKADAAKVSSLLLKLFSTQNVQSIPSTPEGLKQLGLEDGAEKQGITTKISLQAAEKSAALLLGNMKPATADNPGTAPTQYIRQANSEHVVILKNPIIAPAKPQDWISTELINVLGKSFFKLENYSNGNLLYEIKVDPTNDKIEPALNVATPAGKVVRQALVTQLASGLENLGISDVHALSSKEVVELNFDRASKYYLKNGLVYTITTAPTKDNAKSSFAKISVSFDPKLAEELSQINSNASSTSSSSVSSSGESSTSSSSSSSSSSSVAQIATAEEAAKLSEIYKNWIYVLPEYSSGKFRKNLEDLYENKPEAK